MKSLAAREAKLHFGALLDTAQREPVLIEKHGREVAVILSSEEYRSLKLLCLRAKLALGEKQADKGDFADYSLEAILEKLDE